MNINSNAWDDFFNEDVFHHIIQYIDLYELYQVACLSKTIYCKVNYFCNYEVKKLAKTLLKVFEHQMILESERKLLSELQEENIVSFLPLYAKCKRLLHLNRVSAVDCFQKVYTDGGSISYIKIGTDSPSFAVEHDELLGRDVLRLKSHSNTLAYTFSHVKEGCYTATIRMKLLGKSSSFRGPGSCIIFLWADEHDEHLINSLDVTLHLWGNIERFLETADESSKLEINEDWIVDQYDNETGWFSLRLLELDLPNCCDLKWRFCDEHSFFFVFAPLIFVMDIRWDYIELKPLLETL